MALPLGHLAFFKGMVGSKKKGIFGQTKDPKLLTEGCSPQRSRLFISHRMHQVSFFPRKCWRIVWGIFSAGLGVESTAMAEGFFLSLKKHSRLVQAGQREVGDHTVAFRAWSDNSLQFDHRHLLTSLLGSVKFFYLGFSLKPGLCVAKKSGAH